LIRVELEYRNILKEMEFEIHKSRDMADVYDKVDGWLKRDDILPPPIKFKIFSLLYGGRKLIKSASLIQAGISTDAAI